jgi:hypothetical protein
MSIHQLTADAVRVLPRLNDASGVAIAARPVISRGALGAVAASTLLEALALGWIGLHAGSLRHAVCAGAIHLLAVAPMLLWAGAGRSQRILSGALTFSLPLIGAPIAAFLLGTVGRSELEQLPPEGDDLPAPRRFDDFRRMAEGLSCCEALLASNVEERRAILSTLSRDPDRNAVALLRWALASPNQDLAVEAALALEDLSASFDEQLIACRRELADKPSFTAALALADVIANAIEIGIADAPLIPLLARESRQSFERATELDPERFDVAAAGRARMELAVLRPDTALEVIDAALGAASPPMRLELGALRQEAVLASHSLPWEGPSALLTYRRPLPRAGTTRRHVLFPILGAEVPRGRTQS